MSVLFLLICLGSLLFFAIFLVQCSRAHRASRKRPLLRRVNPTETVDSAAGRRALVHLEQQMAEFLSTHGRRVSVLLLAMLLFGAGTATKAQSSGSPDAAQTGAADQQVPPAVQKQLDAMQKRIEQLEAELNARAPQGAALTSKATAAVHEVGDQTAPAAAAPAESALAQPATPENQKPAPFSFADFSWLNGNSRIKEVPFDTKFFTPEIRADVDYIYNFRSSPGRHHRRIE